MLRLFVLSLIFPFLGVAQPFPCGTKISKEQFQLIQQTPKDLVLTEDTFLIPIKVFVVINEFGNAVVDSNQIYSEVDSANYFFKNAKIQFEVCQLTHIPNPQLAIFDSPEEEDIISSYGEDDRTINLYYVEELYLDGTRVCGFAYFPPGESRIFIDATCANLANTLTHELGHYFGLLHTHGLSNVNRSLELVDRSNCSETGDNICDTPADPILIDKVNNNCDYTAGELDWKGQPYEPMTRNIMAYTNPFCSDTLTNGQYQFIRNALFRFGRVDYSCTPDNQVFDETKINFVKPNPIAQDFIVEVVLAQEGRADLSIYDTKGVRIARLFNSELPAGKHKKYINHISGLTRGLYFLSLTTENHISYKPILFWN
ncbi:MAG: zinc-dependent metalloprotease [Flavobacteriales bacterium]|nr:zinc-dependent metalloprotease [Flavobacteriales bacterium]